jgi:MFS family permease
MSATAVAATGSVLRERGFRLYFAGQATSVIGDALVPVALAFAVLGVTGSATALGLVLAAGTVPTVLFVLFGGVWADRLLPRRVMIASDLVRALAQGGIAGLLLAGRATLAELMVLTALWGTAAAFFRPASTRALPDLVDAARLQEANGLMSTARNSANVLGPALAGILVAGAGAGVALAIDAATFLVSALSLAAIGGHFARSAPSGGAQPSMLAELRGGWREFVSRRWLFAIVVWAALFHFFVLAPYFVLGPLIAKTQLGGAGAWAAIATAFGAGTIGGSLLAMRLKTDRTLLLAVVPLALFALPVLALALGAPVAVDAPAALLGGLGIGVFGVLFGTAMQRDVPREALSRVSAYDWLGSLALLPLGFAVTGPAAQVFGAAPTLFVAAGWMLLSTLVLLLVPDVRRRDGALSNGDTR